MCVIAHICIEALTELTLINVMNRSLYISPFKRDANMKPAQIIPTKSVEEKDKSVPNISPYGVLYMILSSVLYVVMNLPSKLMFNATNLTPFVAVGLRGVSPND